MHVRLFGFDIEITMGFWLTAVMLAFMESKLEPISIVLWALVLLISVLVHELGHGVAYRVFGVRSNIRLHFLGGATYPTIVLPLARWKQVIVSLAGPFAGLALAIAAYVLLQTVHIAHPGFHKVAMMLFYANLGWTILNLLPVLPLDGGHVVEHTLGPKRYRITLWISAVTAVLLVGYSISSGQMFGVYIFGAAAVQAFIQLRDTATAVRASKEGGEVARSTTTEALDPATTRALKDAKAALEEDDTAKAIDLARGVLHGRELGGARPQARAIPEALTILGWAHLARGEIVDAADAVGRLTRMTRGDNALVAAVHMAKGDDVSARNLLEAARAEGDTRKEVFGPLIQILLKQGEPVRAAALANDCEESISSDDLRALATMVAEKGVHHWAGKLREVVFKRERDAEDAFEAARHYARASDTAKAIDLMRIAVHAGFTDSRRVYADEALVGIDELEHILPRTL